jgi:hypothetical protein
MYIKPNLLAVMAVAIIGLSGCDKGSIIPPPPPAPVAPVAVIAPIAAKAQFSIGAETAESVATLKVMGTCALDSVVTMVDGSLNTSGKNAFAVTKAVAYRLSGFATDVEKGNVPKSLKMLLVGAQTYGVSAAAGLERPDVAAYFKQPPLGTAGYQIEAGFDSVAPGDYLAVILNLDDAAPRVCPTHQTIPVK